MAGLHRGIGGAGRDRTADKGFADLCLTTWRPRPVGKSEANAKANDSTIPSGAIWGSGALEEPEERIAFRG